MALYYQWRRSQIGYKDNVTHVQTATIYPTWGDNGDHRYAIIYSKAMSEGLPDTNGLYWVFEKSTNSSQTGDAYVIHRGGSYVGASAQTDIMYCGTTASQPLELTIPASGNAVTISSNALFEQHKRSYTAGTFVDYVYSTDLRTYPNGGVQGDYYYDQRTTVTSPTVPTLLTYPNPITTRKFTVSWNAATSNIPDYPVTAYLVSASDPMGPYLLGKKRVSATETSAELQIEITTPDGPAKSLLISVQAIDSNNERTSAYSPKIPIYLSPTLSVPSQLMQGQPATISWSAIEGADSYTLQRKSSADADWTQVYSGANLSYSETVGTWTSVQYRVQAVFSGTPGGWATSASIPVISPSALVISGSDGDLGTVVNDIPYSISTDTGNQITATITVNSAVIFSGNVGNSTSDVIPVLDLVNGEGTIVIEASVQATSGPVSAVRTWTYTKAPITFPNAGSVAQLTKEGENIFPKTLAECVRLPGGKTLDEVTAFPCQVYIGSYAGTGTYGAENPCVVNLPFKPLAFTVSIKDVGSGNTIYGQLIWLNGNETGGSYLNSSNTGICTLQWGETSVSWYSSAANFQLNVSGYEYQYMAIG